MAPWRARAEAGQGAAPPGDQHIILVQALYKGNGGCGYRTSPSRHIEVEANFSRFMTNGHCLYVDNSVVGLDVDNSKVSK